MSCFATGEAEEQKQNPRQRVDSLRSAGVFQLAYAIGHGRALHAQLCRGPTITQFRCPKRAEDVFAFGLFERAPPTIARRRASSQLAVSAGNPFYSEASGAITAALRAPAKMFDEYSVTGQTRFAPITLSTKATFMMLRSAKPSKA